MGLARRLAALALAGLLVAPATGWAQDGAARQRQLAQQIMDETGMTANLDGMMKDMIQRMMTGVAGNMDPDAKARTEGLTEAVTAAMLRVKPRITQVSIDAYAQTFSEEELSGILDFYRTPVGRAMASKMPLLMRNITDASVSLMPEMQAVMAAELCARQSCPDAVKAMAAKAPLKP